MYIRCQVQVQAQDRVCRVCRDKHDPSKRGMNLDRSRMEAGQVQGLSNPLMGLAGQGVIYGGGAPQFPLLGGQGVQGVQGGSMWGNPVSHSYYR